MEISLVMPAPSSPPPLIHWHQVRKVHVCVCTVLPKALPLAVWSKKYTSGQKVLFKYIYCVTSERSFNLSDLFASL